jgi:hypothetical protein
MHMNATRALNDRYLDQPYDLSGRLIDPIGGTVDYANQRHPLKRKELEVLACLADAGDAMVSREWTGSTTSGCWDRSGTSRQRRPKRPMIGNRSRYRWRRDSHKMVSGVPGAIHRQDRDTHCRVLSRP